MNALNGLARRLGIAIILSIHTSKSSDGSVSRSASGSTAWVFATRSVLLLDAGAQDEPPSLTLIKANHSPPGTVVLLEWRDGVLLAAPQQGALERRIRAGQLDRLIFATVQDGWDRRMPYSSEPQARTRYLPGALQRTTEFTAREIQAAMQMWIDNGFLLAGQQHSTKTPRGLRVAKLPHGVADGEPGERQ